MGINAQHLKLYVIRPTLRALDLYSSSAENLLLGTCAKESLLGTYLKQIEGVALGIYQIEPATHDDVWRNYLKYRPELTCRVLSLGLYGHNQLTTNLAYATAIARIVYLRVSEPLPDADNIPALAAYWKKYYNTEHGAGTEDEFISCYQNLIKSAP